MSKCKIKIYYEKFKNDIVLNKNLSSFENYQSLREAVITASNEKKQLVGIKKIAVKKGDKIVLEIVEPKIGGINSIFNEETFNFFHNKVNEGHLTLIKLYITKVEKYPDWSPPQIYEILKNTLQSASDENSKVLIEELAQEKSEELNNGQRVYFVKRNEEKSISEENIKDVHLRVFCNNCPNNNFFGNRYICAECDNYNLCQNCYTNERFTHCKEHTFILIKSPIMLDLSLFSCLFINKRKIINVDKFEAFDFEIEIINNGIESLQGCFISPIRFGKKYIGCTKDSIESEVQNGQKYTMKTMIKFEDENIIEKYRQYEGYFRLMTQEGLPFGDIFYLQVNYLNNA